MRSKGYSTSMSKYVQTISIFQLLSLETSGGYWKQHYSFPLPDMQVLGRNHIHLKIMVILLNLHCIHSNCRDRGCGSHIDPLYDITKSSTARWHECGGPGCVFIQCSTCFQNKTPPGKDCLSSSCQGTENLKLVL